jgi:hypothetical protein
MINPSFSQELIEQLRAALAPEPVDAATLCRRLNLSQSTFSRLWRAGGVDIIRFGAARSTTYGVTRSVGDLGSLLPLFEVLPDGRVVPFGELRTLRNNWNVFTPAGSSSPHLMRGLPYFLQDLRPQGFLGRLVPGMHRELLLPERIQDWSDDDTLRYLARRGEDALGNLIVGNESYRRYLDERSLAERDVAPESERERLYALLADRANQGDAPGSSAGGEQPKFTSAIRRDDGRVEHVIVKFSAPRTSAHGRRWADLLIAEHLAMETLRENGISACESQVLLGGARAYLEVVRFDRIGRDGRKAIVSMTGVDCLLGALDQNWTNSCLLLRDKRLLPVGDWEHIRLLDVFGALIGNSDRHPANLSLHWDRRDLFSLAPIYDMLPMMYQPNRQGEIVARRFDMAVLDRLDLRCLPEALTLASLFWGKVATDARVSDDFRRIALAHAAAIGVRTSS